ncbi:MAG: substrate-binding domain-containing protein [Lachnospiraceae bacterium]|nr:substrate-binding domain-containing protein [Lachnospiraceae bacterium]
MTRSRFYFGTLVLVFVAVIAWTYFSMMDVEKEEKSYRVSVIVNNSTSDRWTALRLGLEQAAKDCGIDLNYVSTGQLESVEEEMALINRELENGAEGIIVQMVSSEEYALNMIEKAADPAIILLESDVIPETTYALAGPDNIEVGRAVSDAVKQDFDKELYGKKIGILAGNQKQISMQQRLQGLKDGFADTEIDIAWEITSAEYASVENSASFETWENVDIVIALGNDETERMVDFVQREEVDMEAHVLYGVGCSEKAVYYLDKGVIKILVVPNEFNLGYQSMESIAKQLKYHLSRAEDSQVGYLVIDQTNLYDEENQKMLFPIVQ